MLGVAARVGAGCAKLLAHPPNASATIAKLNRLMTFSHSEHRARRRAHLDPAQTIPSLAPLAALNLSPEACM
jgi:hypothetical protein